MAVLVVNVIAPAASSATRSAAASHPCPVLGGAGDPTFTRNFNPYSGSKMDLRSEGLPPNEAVSTPQRLTASFGGRPSRSLCPYGRFGRERDRAGGFVRHALGSGLASVPRPRRGR